MWFSCYTDNGACDMRPNTNIFKNLDNAKLHKYIKNTGCQASTFYVYAKVDMLHKHFTRGKMDMEQVSQTIATTTCINCNC